MAYRNQYNSNNFNNNTNYQNANQVKNVNFYDDAPKKPIYNQSVINQFKQHHQPAPPVAPRQDKPQHYEPEEEERVEYDQGPKKPAILYNFLNTLTFGFGLSLFLIGIIYLSIYRYEYSLTVLSIDLIAGFFLAIGCILVILSTIRILTIKNMDTQINLALLIALVLLAFFVLLLVLGAVGLSMKDNDQLLHEARSNLQSTARNYDESSTFKHETKKINYIQMRFNCCGVDSHNDWKTIHSYRNPNQPVRYADKYNYENNLAYRDDVPDSCCINHSPGCGKTTYTYQRDRASVIYTRGCLSTYLKYFSTDLTYLCALSLTVSIIFFGMSLAFAFVHMRLKSSVEFEDYHTNIKLMGN